MEITLFPVTSKAGKKMFIGKHSDGKPIICSDPDLKSGYTLILELSDDKSVYFAKVKENGITCKVE